MRIIWCARDGILRIVAPLECAHTEDEGWSTKDRARQCTVTIERQRARCWTYPLRLGRNDAEDTMNPELLYALEQAIEQAEQAITQQECAIARAVYELARVAPQA